MSTRQRGMFFLWDGLAAALSVGLAFRLHFGLLPTLPSSYIDHEPVFLLAVVLIFWGMNLAFRTYEDRGTGVSLRRPLSGILFAAFGTGALVLFLDRRMALGVPAEVVFILSLLLVTLSLTGRLLPVLLHSFFCRFQQRGSHTKRAVIYGAGELGCYLVEKLREEPESGILPVAFVDDNPQKSKKLLGLRVTHSELLERLLPAYRADLLIVAINRLPKEKLKEVLAVCGRARVGVQRFGLSDEESPGNGVKGALLTDIDLTTLLRRDSVTLNMEAVRGLVEGSRVLVTGAAGSIGSELCRQVLRFGARELVLFDIHENGLFQLDRELQRTFDPSRYHLVLGSVRDRARLDQVMEQYQPQLVLHAAAHKHVPMMELSPTEAVKNNVFGTLNTALCAIDHRVSRFLLISTDKAVNPTNIMGASKRIAELIIQALSISHPKTLLCAVRFGNVLGSNGSVVPIFQRQIAEGGPVTVTHPEMRRFFMTIPEAVELVLEAVTMAMGGEIFVLDMGKPMGIYDLACDMIRLAGLEPERDIPIVFTGVRPGEKLMEEIALAEEDTCKTANSQIYVNKPTELDGQLLCEQLWALRKSLDSQEPDAFLREIQVLVPTFAHKG